MQVDAEYIRNLNEPLKKIVHDAANAIMEVYKKDDFESAIKSDGSPVTEADNSVTGEPSDFIALSKSSFL